MSVDLDPKSLIIGYNDVGKTNLLRAVRLLLDRSLSDAELDPRDSDFCAFNDTDELQITLHFTNVVEDCLVAKLKGFISDGDEMYLVYKGFRNAQSGKKDYELHCGPELDSLKKIESRFYLKVLNLRFIESRRDLLRFIRRERRLLLEDSKENREETEVEEDVQTLQRIEDLLAQANESITSLNYVHEATVSVNEQLSLLSYRLADQEISFDTGAADPEDFITRLELVSRVNGKSVGIGGDGRSNQIQLALWTARNQLAAGIEGEQSEVVIYCIEEPEAHLHPHQQRKLASYLAGIIEAQVILTSHSPQIAAEFAPNSLIRLYDDVRTGTRSTQAKHSSSVDTPLLAFGYRLNVLSAEVFFASAVFLVEGPSELIFYKALASALNIDLDQFNVSVLSVNGVGFTVYAKLLESLGIPFTVRTDRDVFGITGTDDGRHAGVLRAVELCRTFRPEFDEASLPPGFATNLAAFPLSPIPTEVVQLANDCSVVCADHGVFLAEVDLETDLAGHIPDVLTAYLGVGSAAEAIFKMKQAKATFMFDFVLSHTEDLRALEGTPLVAPLMYCIDLVRSP